MGNQPLFRTSGNSSSSSFTEQIPVLENESVEIAPYDPYRMCFMLHNERGILYVRFGDEDVTKFDYTYRLTSNCILENDYWKGRITAIKEQGDSIAQFTVAIGGY